MPKKKAEEKKDICLICGSSLKKLNTTIIQVGKTTKIKEIMYVCSASDHFGRYVYDR